MLPRLLLLVLAPGLSLGAQTAAAADRPARPHVVLILADDLGWTDLSTGRTNGGRGSPWHRTPNLDALAAAGTCFTDAYSSGPNCAPTRAALWSGKWAARTGIYTVGGGNRGAEQHRRLDAAPNRTVLAGEFVTLAERLRELGYHTGHFGKWHLGGGAATSPGGQGFEHAVGGNQRGGVGSDGHFAAADGAFPLPGLGPLPAPDRADGEHQFLADRLTDEAIAWLAATTTGPSFCVVSHYSVHTPIQTPARDLPTAPPPADSQHRHVQYCGMLKNLDDNVGRVVAWLEANEDPQWPGHRRIENTLLLFTSDNGGLGGYADAGIAGGQEITNNRPLRSGKGSLHEGGIRVPLIARWDGRVRAGAVDTTPLQSLDLHPTLIALCGGEVPGDLDGSDLARRFGPEPGDVPERALYWHFPGYLQADGRRGTWRTTPGSVIRRGDHKLIWWYETGTAQLFDLANDLGEDRDLAEQQPERCDELVRELGSWLERTAAPLPRTREGPAVPLPAPRPR
ncbi:MAG: sulfatase [Planctomycetes bacterium]|nr:sulfatase [Planctomycetota bacterium]